jgi:hypothetical protein
MLSHSGHSRPLKGKKWLTLHKPKGRMNLIYVDLPSNWQLDTFPYLKGQCHEIFCFWFFSWISFPQASEYTIGAVSNFFENSRRYSQLKVDHRYQRHQWQTMRLISGWGYLIVNLKAKIYIYVNSTIQRCPNKIIKIFLIEDFFHLPRVSATPVVNLELRISLRILEKILTLSLAARAGKKLPVM